MVTQDIEYEFHERAGILEFDAGMERGQAEAWARQWIKEKYGVEI